MLHSSNEEQHQQAKLFDVILSGGPPWGFTLSGGSEFGSKLYVKKVTDENKAVEGNLYSGDEILSVNGVSCTSRANAIQMVRSIEEELRLKICRWSDHAEAAQNSQSHSMYNNMVENMNDLSSSTYSLKRNSIQTKHLNNNENTVNGNYKILSINKSSASNEHNIRIGIPSIPRVIDEYSVDEYNERSVDEPINYKSQSEPNTPQIHQRQKVTVKMVPAAQPGSKHVSPNASSFHSNKIVHPDQTDAVENESLQKVSTSRAMFESMSTSKVHQKKLSTGKANMKTWKSGPVLENTAPEEDKSYMQPPPVQHLHQHSRSLPIEMAGKEFEKAMENYKKHKSPDPSNGKRSTERPKSAHYYLDGESSDTPSVPERYSQSELLRSFRTKGNYASTSFEKQNSTLPSYSSEDLRHLSDSNKGRTVPATKNDSANELRQAANRYHQELMKNYPKFRHSISKDTAAKFSRKVSMPTEDAFSRGEPYRATIATASTSRMPRSYSANDTLDMPDVQEYLSKSNDHSMMSRLLRDQNQQQASLMKIDESQMMSSISLKNHNNTPLQRSSTDPEKDLKSSEALSRSLTTPDSEIKHSERETNLDFIHDVQAVPLDRQQLDDIMNARTMNGPPSRDTNSYKDEYSKENRSSTSTPTDQWQHATHFETDIDSEEAERIIHRKEPSTDSAVYMMPEADQISHGKALSNESTDSMNELSQIANNAAQKARLEEEYNTEFLPPPPDEFLQDEEHENIEKEKPQRTINRKKKDSYAVSSRNNSCVSTDSTTSTTTVDSGIVVRSDCSPRTSPLSGERYYSGSRETLDDDVADLNDEPHATSTPERYEQAKEAGYRLMRQSSIDCPNEETTYNSSGDHSRSGSGVVNSPRSDDLDCEKSKLMDSMREKINELRDQEQEIADEIKMNEELGKKVLKMVEAKATQSEFSKFELFIGELNKIVALLLSLTQRLHRYELMLQDLDMSNEADKAKKDTLVSKIDKLKSQHEEACYLRDVNDKRGDNVATFLEKYCSEEEFADFQYYVDMKSQLALMQSEIREKVKLGEERLKALESTGSEWGFG